MAYQKPKIESKIISLNVDWVSEIKENKKGKPFISVKSGKDMFWYVGDERIFHYFKKGETVQCLVQDGEFKSVIDVVDDSFVAAREKNGREEKRENISSPEFFVTKHDWDLLNSKLDKIGKIVVENGSMLTELTLGLALDQNGKKDEEEVPDLDKTAFPPKQKTY
jgi:hypothetical protein